MEKLHVRGHILVLEPAGKAAYLQFDGGKVQKIASRTFADFLRLHDEGKQNILLRKVRKLLSTHKFVDKARNL